MISRLGLIMMKEAMTSLSHIQFSVCKKMTNGDSVYLFGYGGTQDYKTQQCQMNLTDPKPKSCRTGVTPLRNLITN